MRLWAIGSDRCQVVIAPESLGIPVSLRSRLACWMFSAVQLGWVFVSLCHCAITPCWVDLFVGFVVIGVGCISPSSGVWRGDLCGFV